MNIPEISDIIGIIGVAAVLWAYCGLQIRKIDPESMFFSSMNLLGSVLILFSLHYHPNIASFIIEIAWLAISLYGVFKAVRSKKQTA